MACVIPLRLLRPTGDRNCWFCAAQTIVYHRTAHLLHEADLLFSPGLSSPESAGRLASPATRPSQDLERILRTSGPLWFGGAYCAARHAVVIHGIDRGGTGTTTDEIDRIPNGDPATGPYRMFSVERFKHWKLEMPGLWNLLVEAGR